MRGMVRDGRPADAPLLGCRRCSDVHGSSAPAHLLDVRDRDWLHDRRLLVDADGRIEAILGPDDAAPDAARRLDLRAAGPSPA